MEKTSIYQELCEIEGLSAAMPRRAAYLHNKMDAFIKKLNFQNNVVINENSLVHLVFDYFTDIVRLKTFQGIKHTNKEKIIAYTSYWICRRKPIQITTSRIDDKYVFINEAFTVSFIRDELMNMTENKMIPDIFIKHIYYHLKYRAHDAKSFELFIQSYLAGNVMFKG